MNFSLTINSKIILLFKYVLIIIISSQNFINKFISFIIA